MFEYFCNIRLESVGLELVIIVLVCSAERTGMEILIKILGLSLIYIGKDKGTRINSWGTPCEILQQSVVVVVVVVVVRWRRRRRLWWWWYGEHLKQLFWNKRLSRSSKGFKPNIMQRSWYSSHAWELLKSHHCRLSIFCQEVDSILSQLRKSAVWLLRVLLAKTPHPVASLMWIVVSLVRRESQAASVGIIQTPSTYRMALCW